MLEDVVHAAHRAYNGTGAVEAARKLLKDPEAPATVLLVAARRVLGPEFLAYEPETLWQELDVPAMNRDKLLAAMALVVHPSFYWDTRVFGSTVLAFNDEVVFASAMPQTTPEQLAWGVLEAEIIFGITDDSGAEPEYDVEPVAYAAAMLADAGYAFVPEELEFAEEHLDPLLSKDGRDLHAKVKAAPTSSKAESSEEDPALDVQLERRAGINAYVEHRLEALKQALAAF